MNENVIIIGAGGHARVVSEIVELAGDRVLGFIDDRAPELFPGMNMLGTTAEIGAFSEIASFVIAIGDNYMRRKIDGLHKLRWYSAIHPTVVISKSAEIGEGTVIMANAVINSSAKIGRHCIINTASVVEHDCVLGNCVHIAPKAALGGAVKVGDCTQVGLGANLINNVSICGGCVIGAGAAVVGDISEKGIYAGVPAQKIKFWTNG